MKHGVNKGEPNRVCPNGQKSINPCSRGDDAAACSGSEAVLAIGFNVKTRKW